MRLLRKRDLKKLDLTKFFRVSIFIAFFAVLFVVISGIVFVEFTSTPTFCKTCHIMRPFYESWEKSSHKDVSCVQCHYPPSLEGTIKQKFVAINQVAKYITGAYKVRSWAEIEDASCMRSGCHTQRLLSGRVKFENVFFDHKPHLTYNRRGKKLRCTSCHSQIVQGKHIAVTESTCFLCHFNDVPYNKEIGRCKMCHETPKKEVSIRGGLFDHSQVETFQMDCLTCHRYITKGEGDVPKPRCFSCHQENEKLKHYKDGKFLHKIHVTDHKVDCLLCHQEIQHAVGLQVSEDQLECKNCHLSSHTSTQELLYGQGGFGVKAHSNIMLEVGVDCKSCHTIKGVTKKGEKVLTANNVSCMTCHGPEYKRVFKEWKLELDERQVEIKKLLELYKPVADPYDTVIMMVNKNLELVKMGHGVHNYNYARDLLKHSSSELIKFINKKKVSLPDNLINSLYPVKTVCLNCHSAIKYWPEVDFKGKKFNHEKHLLIAKLSCNKCHSSGIQKEKATDHGLTLIKEKACNSCHHKEENENKCKNCHKETEQLFKGKIFGQEIEPSFKAENVSCAGCHINAENGKLIKDINYCGTCHDADYVEMGKEWLKESNRLKLEIKKIKGKAQTKELLLKANPIHNLDAVETIIDNLK